jgi:hypothetical protein
MNGSPQANALAANDDAGALSNGAPESAATPCPAREPYTGRETKILLSFAMKSGGHLFSQWLRNALMGKLDYFSPNSIYVDTVASREHLSIHKLVMPQRFRLPGVTYIAPDRRYEKEEGYAIIGGLNSRWNSAYTKAMSQAKVMLFLLTPDYQNSQWCMMEWQQFQDENERRKKKGKEPLHGLVVGFESDEETRKFADGKADALTVAKIETSEGHATALAPGLKGKALDDAAVTQILDWAKAHGA